MLQIIKRCTLSLFIRLRSWSLQNDLCSPYHRIYLDYQCDRQTLPATWSSGHLTLRIEWCIRIPIIWNRARTAAIPLADFNETRSALYFAVAALLDWKTFTSHALLWLQMNQTVVGLRQYSYSSIAFISRNKAAENWLTVRAKSGTMEMFSKDWMIKYQQPSSRTD